MYWINNLILINLLIGLNNARPNNQLNVTSKLTSSIGISTNLTDLNSKNESNSNDQTNNQSNQWNSNNQSKLNNQLNNLIKSGCSLNDCPTVTITKLTNDLKLNNLKRTNSQQSNEIVQKNETLGHRREQDQSNEKLIEKPLDEDLLLPHSRPEFGQDEDSNSTNFNSELNQTSLKEQIEKFKNKTNINLPITPFTPITISWLTFNNSTKQGKCKVKEIPNSTYKLRYNGYSVRYYCNDNYKAKGQTRLYCIQGSWNTNSFPICARKSSKT